MNSVEWCQLMFWRLIAFPHFIAIRAIFWHIINEHLQLKFTISTINVNLTKNHALRYNSQKNRMVLKFVCGAASVHTYHSVKRLRLANPLILTDTTTTTKSHFLTLFSWVFESLVKSLMLVKSQRKWFCLLFWRCIIISYLLIFAPVQSHYFRTFSVMFFFLFTLRSVHFSQGRRHIWCL